MSTLSRLRGRQSVDTTSLVLYAIAVIVLLGLWAAIGGAFYNPTNLQSMGFQVAEFAFLALAMGIAMLTGGIDLSVVGNATLAGIVAAKLLSGEVVAVTDGNGALIIVLAVVAAVLVGTLGGALNGFLIARLTVSPILATLGTHILFVGIASALTGGSSVPVMVPGYARLGVITVAGFPLIFLLAAVAFAAVGFLLTRTRIGREIHLHGSNPVAARFAGLRGERALMVTYMIAGALVSVAGLIMVARFNSARVGFGGTYLLQAILVVVLAGFDPFGGRGRIANLAVGVLLLQALQSGFTVKGFNPFVKNLVWGSVLLIVMVVNFWASRMGSRRIEPVLAQPEDVSEVTDDEYPVPV